MIGNDSALMKSREYIARRQAFKRGKLRLFCYNHIIDYQQLVNDVNALISKLHEDEDKLRAEFTLLVGLRVLKLERSL